ncbi:MAG: hypothetical protein WBB27_12295, partial [Maribacter sp.]
MKLIIKTFLVLFLSLNAMSQSSTAKIEKKIDREALVKRHHLTFNSINASNIPQVGNGEIAFGIDVTGLQSLYGNTLSQWGWHTSPLPKGKTMDDFKMAEYQVHGHNTTYPVKSEGQEEIYKWLRENPHRLNLGKFSFMIDGKRIDSTDITEINQNVDLWQGVITSKYLLKGVPVEVITLAHPKSDAIAVNVKSALIQQKRLTVQLALPYGSPTNKSGADWNAADKHSTSLSTYVTQAIFSRKLDNDAFKIKLDWNKNKAILKETDPHIYVLKPDGTAEEFSFVCNFTQEKSFEISLNFEQTLEATKKYWKQFWTTGGAIDLSGSSDKRWKELERRIVLSQYLLAVNEAGSLPPQESGLLLNSGWFGKFHLEMHWWHGAHYQLWNRWPLFKRSLQWYQDVLPVAETIAKRQGYLGARWPKMIGPDGRFGPSKIGPFLIWQQPHPLFYAEQNYR